MDFSSIRVNDEERTAAIEQINNQHALGRLDTTEADIRVTAALSAQTAAELHVLIADLPHIREASTTDPRDGSWKQQSGRTAFSAFCLVAGSFATVAATDSVRVGVISMTAGICGVALGRFSKAD